MGYNTSHALAVLPKFMPTPAQAKLELLIICFGANDSCLPDDPTGHHVPVDIYRNNLIAMINNARVQAHKPLILLVTPPPIDERQQIITDRARGCTQTRRTVENTERYVKACREVGSQLKIPVVDIWTSFFRHAGLIESVDILGCRGIVTNEAFQSLFSDGLHLTSAGYRLVFENVMKCLKVNYSLLDPDKMEYCYPPWEVAPKLP
ncbi:SGNH hydrolase [Hyaloscypha hepaticicola]|uniref:SGNH hydrolase n=1 Tax=Hyaloscypha hepaticicola TaxID=2082293 RepID=A0A2J6QE85_9HELO|nr:SGNH hydrolase [Hyaloscypha hepaticicola]